MYIYIYIHIYVYIVDLHVKSDQIDVLLFFKSSSCPAGRVSHQSGRGLQREFDRGRRGVQGAQLQDAWQIPGISGESACQR